MVFRTPLNRLQPKYTFHFEVSFASTHTLEFWMSSLLRSIQQPIIKCVVTKRNAAELLAPVYVPCTHTHSDLLGSCVLVVVLTHAQKDSGRR